MPVKGTYNIKQYSRTGGIIERTDSPSASLVLQFHLLLLQPLWIGRKIQIAKVKLDDYR